MKVLHIIGGGDVGGAKTHVLSLLKELSSHIGIKLISLRPGEFTDEGLSMGIDIVVVNSGNLLKDIRNVISILQEDKYDMIHSHGAKANMFAAIIKKRFSKPTITTIHSDYRLDYLRSKSKMLTYGMINTIALRFIDNYIAVSNNFREMLIHRNFSSDRIFTLYNGISFKEDITPFSRKQFSEKYGIQIGEDDIVIGTLARLDPVKRLDIYLKAAAIILKQKPGIKFIIGGDGVQLADLKRKATTLGISENVYFPGWVDRNEFFQIIDMNVLTSISESFSYAILEGTQYKKATVCSCVGGFPDLIDNGENGFLFEPGNYEELAECLLTLAENKEMREEMGERLYQKSKAHFSLEHMCSTQLDIYKKVIASHAQSETSRGYDVVISGYYGFGNSGDEAILTAIINSLRSYKKDIRIVVLSKNPAETKDKYKVASVNRFNPFQFIPVLRKTRMFLYGGGNLIQDDTSTRSLLYYLSIVWMAKKCGNRVMLYANGIGPVIRNNINKWLTRIILNQVDVITLREELSLQELQSLNINKPRVLVTADVALTTEAIDKSLVETILVNEGICPQDKFVGISVRDVMTLSNYENWDGINGFIEAVVHFADYLVEDMGLIPLFIPMQNPTDLDIIGRITEKMRNRHYVLKNKYNESEMLGIIKNVEILVGMRLHSLIYAASMGVPIIGLAYQPKVDAFLKSVQQSSGFAIEDVNTDNLKAMFCEVWRNRESIKEELNRTMTLFKEKAWENARIALELLEDEK